jgi:hypothetical protein
LTKPLLPQPLKHTIAPNDNAAAASITGKPCIFRSRLRIGLMPAIGSSGLVNQAAQSYTVVVTATDTVANAHASANVNLTVQ